MKNESRKKREINLAEWLDENHNLLSCVGIFMALTIYSANLTPKTVATSLSCVFMGIAILILWEIWNSKHPGVTNGSLRLNLFLGLLSMSILSLFIYWELTFRESNQIWNSVLIFFIALDGIAKLGEKFHWRRYFEIILQKYKWTTKEMITITIVLIIWIASVFTGMFLHWGLNRYSIYAFPKEKTTMIKQKNPQQDSFLVGDFLYKSTF